MLSRLELLAEIETIATCHAPAVTDRHQENDEDEYIVDNLERWHDRDFKERHDRWH